MSWLKILIVDFEMNLEWFWNDGFLEKWMNGEGGGAEKAVNVLGVSATFARRHAEAGGVEHFLVVPSLYDDEDAFREESHVVAGFSADFQLNGPGRILQMVLSLLQGGKHPEDDGFIDGHGRTEQFFDDEQLKRRSANISRWKIRNYRIKSDTLMNK